MKAFQVQYHESLWKRLGRFWDLLTASFSPASQAESASEASRVRLAVALGRLERNLLAGKVEYQMEAM